MKTLTNRLMTFVAVLLAILAITIYGQIAHAQDEEIEAQTTQAEQQENGETSEVDTREGYRFTTPRGGSLSLMVRRSLQLYSDSRDTELSSAAAIYCETRIVNEMGGRLLEVGEEVTIPFSQLQSCIDDSKSLSDDQIAAWQRYADQANFDAAASITPVNAEIGNEATGQEGDESVVELNEQSENAESEDISENSSENNGLAWYWWVLGIAAIGAIYYFAGRRAPESK